MSGTGKPHTVKTLVIDDNHRPEADTPLCRLDDIDAVGAKGFSFGEGREAFTMFVVRRNDEVWGYVNHCPHVGGNLDWVPDQFFDLEKTHIMCATHGAKFEFDTGICVSAPCPGAKLEPIAVEISGGDVVIA